MAKIYLKESEIRRYVRTLIREAMETEAAKDPEDIAEREKMLAGQQYDRSKFPLGGQSLKIEREYRNSRNLPPLKKPKGGVIPRIIGADGNDLTPENSPEAIQQVLRQRVKNNVINNAKRYIKVGDREEFAKNHDIDSDDAMNVTHDIFANNVDNDPVTQKWLAMTPDEREAESKRIRQERNRQSSERNIDIIKQISDAGRRAIKYPTKEELEQKIETLKAKRDALEDNDLNRYDRAVYDHIINDTQRIINKYYNGIDTYNSSDAADDIVKYAMDDIDSDSRYNELAADQGENYVDPSEFEPKNEPQIDKDNKENDNYEPLDVVGRKTKKTNFDDAREMGMFGNDEDFIF